MPAHSLTHNPLLVDGLLPSERLSLKYDLPHQRNSTMTDEDYRFEKDRFDYDRMTAYFERDRDDYIRQGEFTYSNPISI